MTVVSIHQPQYLPYLGFFHKIAHSDVFVALDDTQFQKNGVQNRNKIKTAQGWQWLTVPVQHRFGQLINEVRIDGRAPWPRKHMHTLRANYSRTPYFNCYIPKLEELLTAEYDNLSQLNMALTQWVMSVLEIKTPILLASALNVCGEQTDRLVSICQAVRADCYLSGPGGRQYMELELFAAAGIQVQWQLFEAPVYQQCFPQTDFIPNLSVLDALFNCGPETTRSLIV